MAFFIKSNPLQQRAALAFMGTNLDIGLFALISLCAKIVKHNRRFELANRGFLSSLNVSRGGFTQAADLRQQLKVNRLPSTSTHFAY